MPITRPARFIEVDLMFIDFPFPRADEHHSLHSWRRRCGEFLDPERTSSAVWNALKRSPHGPGTRDRPVLDMAPTVELAALVIE